MKRTPCFLRQVMTGLKNLLKIQGVDKPTVKTFHDFFVVVAPEN
jgi:hypothetical protein